MATTALVALRIPLEMREELLQIAAHERRSFTDVVRIALEDWIVMRRTGVLGEAYQALSDLGEGEHYVSGATRGDAEKHLPRKAPAKRAKR